MTDEIFERAISEAVESKVTTIFPYYFGEPFLDKKIYERCQYILSKGLRVNLFTNLGIPIDENKISMLKGATGIVISYAPGADPEVRDRNIEILRREKFVIVMHVVDENALVVPANTIGRKYDIKVERFEKTNWHGVIHCPGPVKDGRCIRPLEELVILQDGTISLCCMDYDGEIQFGNIMNTSLEEAWKKAKPYRVLPKSKLPFCQKCNMAVLEDYPKWVQDLFHEDD
jgi:radical SAM protein with 4Fe4S-binding SPASM domain